MIQLTECTETLIDRVLTAATTVHRTLGPGLLESVYEKALAVEMDLYGLEYEVQVQVPLQYRGVDLGVGFKADIIVEKTLLLELKSVEKLLPVHISQVITYLKLLGLKRGYLLNFNTPLLKQSIKRISI